MTNNKGQPQTLACYFAVLFRAASNWLLTWAAHKSKSKLSFLLLTDVSGCLFCVFIFTLVLLMKLPNNLDS